MTTPILRIENVSKRYGKKDVLKGASLDREQGGPQDPHRPLRRGEEHAPAVHQLPRQARRGADLAGRTGGPLRPQTRPLRLPPEGGDDLSGLQPLRPSERPGECPDRHGQGEGDGEGGGRRARRHGAGAGRPQGSHAEVPRPALRRPEAAGLDRPGAGDGPQGDAPGRAHLGPRSRTDRRGPLGHPGSRETTA